MHAAPYIFLQRRPVAATATSTERKSAMAWAAGQLSARTARARSSTNGLCTPNSANHAETVVDISLQRTSAVRPFLKRWVIR